MNSPYSIRVDSIRLRAHHGCHAVEAENGADFEVSLEFVPAAPRDPDSDAMSDYADYEAISVRATELFLEKRHALMEPLAHRIARTLLAEFPRLLSLSVTIRKLRPPMPVECAFSEITVALER